MRPVLRLPGALAMIGTCLAAAGGGRLAAQPRAAAPDTAVRRGVDVTPDTVTVGLPFRVQIRVRAPAGSTMEFPVGPDSAASIELLDPRAIRDLGDANGADFTATYRMVAWDVGTQPIRLSDVVVATPDGERRVPLGELEVFVRSVLPADSAQRVPKPPRPPFEIPAPWWRYWWVAALALAALLLAWWLWRRRGPRAAAQVDPYELAEREFARVEALGLVEAGERGRFVALMVEVVRDYLARRVPGAHPSLTTGELLRALRPDPTVPADRLAAVLQESDLVKFARHPVSAERARELARESRAIVRDVNAAVAAREAAEAEAAARAADRDAGKERAA